MKAIVITIGDEILLGQILDTNSRFIARRLTGVGIEVVETRSVADGEGAIRGAVEEAMGAADVVVVTGGLGPTKDDVTKRVLAGYFGMRLVESGEVMAHLERLLANGGMRMNAGNRGQAMVPEGCRVLTNRRGTAPGMWFERGGKVLVSLPGVPSEMEELMELEVVPGLRRRFPGLLLEYRVLKVYGIPESELAARLEGWEERLPEGLSLAYLPSPGVVMLRLTARGEAVLRLEEWMTGLRGELAGLRMVEGEEASLEGRLAGLLLERGVTVATAESCTGGSGAALLTSVPGASGYFRGGVVAYANEVKAGVLGVDEADLATHGAVSEPVVRQMAEGARRLRGTDYAVATSGVAGPTGGTQEKPVGTVARRFVFSFTRAANVAKASLKAAEMLLECVEG